MENNSSENQPSSLVQHAAKFGAIMGAISIAITLLIYAVDYTLLADWKVGIGMLVLFLGFVIYAGINYRSEIGGFISYGKAFQHGFIALAVGGIIGIVFSAILYNVIDPELPQKITDITVEKTGEMMAGFGMSSADVDKKLDEMRADMPANYSFVGQLKTYLWALIAYAVISAITSLFVRKNQPVTF